MNLTVEKIDVHKYGHLMDMQKGLLEKAVLLPENKQLIWDFINFCNVESKIGEARIIKYMYALRRIGELVDRPFKEMTDKDVNVLLARIEDSKSLKGKPYSLNTLVDFRKAISKFWRWLYFDEFNGDAPSPIKRMRIKIANGKREPEIYTKEEIKAIINGMTTIRDKAFFSCLYDLQCRVSELLSRQLRHIRYNEDGDIQILIEADKTSTSHWETLFESVGNFTTWMRLHPLTNNPDAPLWFIRKRDKITPLSYATARKVFYNSCKRQGIRRLKIHTFRKSKATHDLADGVPVAYIEARGSWSKGSQSLRDCYLSIMQKDKDNAYRKKYQMPVNNGHAVPTELKRCTRCEAIMESDTKFCARCGMPANVKAAIEMKELDQKIAGLIDKDMLSEIVKKFVMEELAKKTDGKT